MRMERKIVGRRRKLLDTKNTGNVAMFCVRETLIVILSFLTYLSIGMAKIPPSVFTNTIYANCVIVIISSSKLVY